MGFPVKPLEHETTIRMRTGWWIFRRERQFVGSDTVWHDAYTGKRASTSEEMRLSELHWLQEHSR